MASWNLCYKYGNDSCANGIFMGSAFAFLHAELLQTAVRALRVNFSDATGLKREILE